MGLDQTRQCPLTTSLPPFEAHASCPASTRLGHRARRLRHRPPLHEPNDQLRDVGGRVLRAVVASIRQEPDDAIRERCLKQRQEVLSVQRPVLLAPNCQRRLGRKCPPRRRVRLLEAVRIGGVAFCPANGARRVRRCRERRAVSSQPGVGDEAVVDEAVELQRREDVVVELPEDLLENALLLSLQDPLEPGRDRAIGGRRDRSRRADRLALAHSLR